MAKRVLANVTCVAIAGRAVILEGAPGVGKSTLALELIDRGALLIGDDGIAVEPLGQQLIAHPPPHIAGCLEIRGVGIVSVPTTSAPLALIVALGDSGQGRLPYDQARVVDGIALPVRMFDADGSSLALRTEWALRTVGDTSNRG